MSRAAAHDPRPLAPAPARLALATRAALVVVLLAQAAAVVLAEPWSEGATLFKLTSEHGMTEGDLPAVLLAVLAVAVVALPRR